MLGKRDLVIHYDEQVGKVFFYSTEVENTAEIRTQAFEGVCPEVAFFRGQSPEKAERTLGGLVFALIDLNSNSKIGIRDYAAEAERDKSIWEAELEIEAAAGIAEAQHDLAMLLHSSAMKNKSQDDLIRAENLLHAAASQGHAGAIATLKDWPLLKATAQRRINRAS